MRMRKLIDLCSRLEYNAYQLSDELNIQIDTIRIYLRHLTSVKKLKCVVKKQGRHPVQFYSVVTKSNDWLKDYKYDQETEHLHIKFVKKPKKEKPKYEKPKAKPDIASAWMFNPLC